MKLYTHSLKGQTVNMRGTDVSFDKDGVAETTTELAELMASAIPGDYALAKDGVKVSKKEQFEREPAVQGKGVRAASVVLKEHLALVKSIEGEEEDDEEVTAKPTVKKTRAKRRSKKSATVKTEATAPKAVVGTKEASLDDEWE